MAETDEIESIFRRADTIAVVGCSRKQTKDAHRIPAFIQKMGYRIVPINPHATDDILGETVYDSLTEASETLDDPIDLVDVFRPSEETPEIARETVETDAKVLWLQLGIRNDEARSIASNNGVTFIQDHCLYPEYTARFGKTPRDEWQNK